MKTASHQHLRSELGAGHQILLVMPSLNLVVVRFGGVLAETAHKPKAFHEPHRLHLFEPLMEAITHPGR